MKTTPHGSRVLSGFFVKIPKPCSWFATLEIVQLKDDTVDRRNLALAGMYKTFE